MTGRHGLTTDKATIRLKPETIGIYNDFRDLVKSQGGDVCYVTAELWTAYLKGCEQIPSGPTAISVPKQNIQINMGCTFNYLSGRRARRLPPYERRDVVDVSLNHILPNLVDQWQTLKPEAQRFWRKALVDSGIIEPPAPKRKRRRRPFDFNAWIRKASRSGS